VTGRGILRRLIATIGLILMAPIGLQLVSGTLTARDAAVRAGVVFASVWIGRSLANMAPGGAQVIQPGVDPAGPLDASG
jgi:hypothetical protein